MKFIPKGSITNIPALIQIMAWRGPGDKPLSEPMMVKLPTHIHASLGLNELKKRLDDTVVVLISRVSASFSQRRLTTLY